MSNSVQADLVELIRRGNINGRRVIIADTETGERNIYEDIDQETVTSERMVVVTLQPAFSRACADGCGKEVNHQAIVTHPRAIKDIQKMMRSGWSLITVERDLGERTDATD